MPVKEREKETGYGTHIVKRISITVETLQLWAEQMMANGKINLEQYRRLTDK